MFQLRFELSRWLGTIIFFSIKSVVSVASMLRWEGHGPEWDRELAWAGARTICYCGSSPACLPDRMHVPRDIKARQRVADNKISHSAHFYVARNQSFPAQVRYQTQLQLNAFDRYTWPTTVKNHCTATGSGLRRVTG